MPMGFHRHLAEEVRAIILPPFWLPQNPQAPFLEEKFSRYHISITLRSGKFN